MERIKSCLITFVFSNLCFPACATSPPPACGGQLTGAPWHPASFWGTAGEGGCGPPALSISCFPALGGWAQAFLGCLQAELWAGLGLGRRVRVCGLGGEAHPGVRARWRCTSLGVYGAVLGGAAEGPSFVC